MCAHRLFHSKSSKWWCYESMYVYMCKTAQYITDRPGVTNTFGDLCKANAVSLKWFSPLLCEYLTCMSMMRLQSTNFGTRDHAHVNTSTNSEWHCTGPCCCSTMFCSLHWIVCLSKNMMMSSPVRFLRGVFDFHALPVILLILKLKSKFHIWLSAKRCARKEDRGTRK